MDNESEHNAEEIEELKKTQKQILMELRAHTLEEARWRSRYDGAVKAGQWAVGFLVAIGMLTLAFVEWVGK